MVQPKTFLSIILYSRNPSKTNPENPKFLHKGGTCHLNREIENFFKGFYQWVILESDSYDTFSNTKIRCIIMPQNSAAFFFENEKM